MIEFPLSIYHKVCQNPLELLFEQTKRNRGAHVDKGLSNQIVYFYRISFS